MDNVEQRAKDLVAQMTLTEKVGQTVQYGRCEEQELKLVAEGKIGSLLNVHGPKRSTSSSGWPWRKRGWGFPFSSGMMSFTVFAPSFRFRSAKPPAGIPKGWRRTLALQR